MSAACYSLSNYQVSSFKMERRMNECPMDFRLQQGPAAPDSPFLKPTPSHGGHKDGLAGYKCEFVHHKERSTIVLSLHSVSYSSYQPTSPKTPALPPPHNHSSFSLSPKEKPFIPHQTGSVMTPYRPNESRRSFDSQIHSSTCNSYTSDPPPGSDVSQLDSTLVRSEELDAGEGSEALATLERAESSCKFYSDSIPRRVYKRRRREADRHVCLLPDPDEDLNCKPDSDALPQPDQQKIDASHQEAPPKQAHSPGFIPSVFTFVENHPNLPHILSYYTQFLLNLFIVFFMMYLVYSFWSTIRSDVDFRSREVAAETLAEIAVCAREFRDNRCERSMRVPAMEIMCNFWEKCVNQDPTKVARAMVSANTFAEILNNFVEPITAKTMVP